MNLQSVPILGGPLQGSKYDVAGEPDSHIELTCAAGAFIYQYRTSNSGEIFLKYVGPGPRIRRWEKDRTLMNDIEPASRVTS